jgi:hypothetical protein
MRKHGVKVLDRAGDTQQVEWLIVHAAECPDAICERRLAATYFKIPHGPWSAPPAFAEPVEVRRSRRRVLFRQCSGLTL